MRWWLLVLALAVLTPRVEAATCATISTKPVGRLANAQTGTATGTACVLADDARSLYLDVEITGTCTVTVVQQLVGTTPTFSPSLEPSIGTSTITTSGVVRMPEPGGAYTVSTSSCTGSATVYWQSVRKP